MDQGVLNGDQCGLPRLAFFTTSSVNHFQICSIYAVFSRTTNCNIPWSAGLVLSALYTFNNAFNGQFAAALNVTGDVLIKDHR